MTQSPDQLELELCLRWWEGHSTLSLDSNPFHWKQGWEVAPVDRPTAASFISNHHYLKTLPVNRRRFGLYNRLGRLTGLAVYGVPLNYAAFTPLGCANDEALELCRLVLLDDTHGIARVPCNGESAFVARCHHMLRREGFAGVISYSDPLKRMTTDGREITPGHVGIVYQALSAVYLGTSRPGTLRLLPDGQAFHHRSAQKVRGSERNWQSAIRQLQNHGAGPLRGDPALWLKEWIPKITRAVAHPGQHKYAFALHPAVRRSLPNFNPHSYPTPPQGRRPAQYGRHRLPDPI